MNKLLCIVVLLFTFSVPAHATNQIPDEMDIDGTLSPIFASPLSRRISWPSENGGLQVAPGQCSASWRGFKAFWKIEQDQLLLIRAVINPCASSPKELDLSPIANGDERPIKASWYTGVLVAGRGKTKGESLQFPRYERYTVFVLRRGVVLSRTELDEAPQ